ncbi:MAG: penicillin acylase family protein [Acidobacteria bacterium]|nr:penicillin acylase family protein [Acidobacteriota bacterium]
MKRLRKWLLRTSLALLALLVLVFVGVYLTITSSLARVEGEIKLAGLSAPVKVTRDQLGVPVIEGATLLDVVRAEGFVHAQERFFQMDLARRIYAGELAALFGEAMLRTDRKVRPLRFRDVAARLLNRLPDQRRQIITAYSEGVNQGLADLRARPPEYFVLRAEPQSWTPEDTLLVYFSMYESVSFNDEFEKPLGAMKADLPEPLFQFLTPDTTRFDELLLPAKGGANDYKPLQIPGSEVIDLSKAKPVESERNVVVDVVDYAPGSNSWAVAGARSESGRAIIANDPHLGLSAPGPWFRVELRWDDRYAAGVSVAGFPAIAIGSTGRLAWGFTNAMGDQKDLIVVEIDPADPKRYRTPDGFEPFGEIIEEIKINGSAAERLKIQTTRWGAVTDKDWQGRPLVLKSTALDPAMINIDLLDLLQADSFGEGLDILKRWQGPSLNVLLADSGGRIGCVFTGYIPRRSGFSGKEPVAWTDSSVGWFGPIDERFRPVIADPPEGILFTANNRPIESERSRLLSQVWMWPVRSRRIAELLRAKKTFSENDLLSIQLDIRSAEHDLYRDLVMESTTDNDADQRLARSRQLVASWNGTAGVDQPGFRILRAYRLELHEQILGSLVAACASRSKDFVYNWPLAEEPARRILEERPLHLLPPGHADWRAFLRAVLVKTLNQMEKSGHSLEAPWGEINRAAIGHMFSRGAPLVGRWLDMPADPLPGHTTTVRATSPDFGASMRMVVSPGREESGILHMPAGQSGHPFSAYYSNGHAAWVKGAPTPFRSGQATKTLLFVPQP